MTGTKRKHEDVSLPSIYNNNSRSRPSAEARIDPTYGQRSAIPGLDDDTIGEDEDDLNYGDEIDALAYLRSVRQEASTIPNLLVAPASSLQTDSREIYENGVGDFRGWYEDGAYIALSQHADDNSELGDDVAEDAQQLYFDAILSRYEVLRAQLQQEPPTEAVTNLGNDHPIHLGHLNKQLSGWWIWKMKTVDPKPAQVASMDKSTVLRLLGLMTQGTTLKRGSKVAVGISTWVWSLLARLPDRGELTSEEIGVVRELGKKAVLVGMGLKATREWEEGIKEVEAKFDRDLEEEKVVGDPKDEEILLNDDEYSYEDARKVADPPALSQESTANATTATISSKEPGLQEVLPLKYESADSHLLTAEKVRVLERLQTVEQDAVELEPEISDPISVPPEDSLSDVHKVNTKATVDMILTIVGEIYGQRDLLEFRGTM